MLAPNWTLALRRSIYVGLTINEWGELEDSVADSAGQRGHGVGCKSEVRAKVYARPDIVPRREAMLLRTRQTRV